jgi:hypothetical protein
MLSGSLILTIRESGPCGKNFFGFGIAEMAALQDG